MMAAVCVPPPPTILALDCASRTGWAIATPDAVLDWPERMKAGRAGGYVVGVKFGSYKIPRDGDTLGSLFHNFRRWLGQMVGARGAGIGLIAVEAAEGIRGRAARRILIPLVGIVQEVAWTYNVALLEVAPAAGKAALTGSGVASKSQMIAAARAAGIMTSDPDAADAFGILTYAVTEWRRQQGFTS